MNNKKLVQAFLTKMKAKPNLSKKTFQAYQNDLKQFIQIVHYSVLDMDEVKINHYLEILQKAQDSENTIIRKISTLRRFYYYLLKRHLVRNNFFKYLHFKMINSDQQPKISESEAIKAYRKYFKRK